MPTDFFFASTSVSSVATAAPGCKTENLRLSSEVSGTPSIPMPIVHSRSWPVWRQDGREEEERCA